MFRGGLVISKLFNKDQLAGREQADAHCIGSIIESAGNREVNWLRQGIPMHEFELGGADDVVAEDLKLVGCILSNSQQLDSGFMLR
ncbi:MAG: hypothetical protein E6H06_18620 [Bacteroidetes bacterium]|nr:MAG: hypothetical protein E6H06_18620 [Bacteroidota bacterium]